MPPAPESIVAFSPLLFSSHKCLPGATLTPDVQPVKHCHSWLFMTNACGGCRGPAVAGEHAPQLLSDVLLPPLQWRAGKTAAAVRFHAVTALATLLRRQLVKRKPVLALVDDGTLWPIIAQELDEDWWVWLGGIAALSTQK